jgi:uncharacterized membrane protein
MKKPISKDSVLDIGFYGGLVIKAASSLVEFLGGILMLVLSHDWLNHLIMIISASELSEDPKDMVMNTLIRLGQNLSISSQHSVAIYLLLHGITKLTVIWLLLKKKLWAYPLAVGVFGLFVMYEMYSYFHTRSVLLQINVIVDIAIIVMVVLEYKHLKVDEVK